MYLAAKSLVLKNPGSNQLPGMVVIVK